MKEVNPYSYSVQRGGLLGSITTRYGYDALCGAWTACTFCEENVYHPRNNFWNRDDAVTYGFGYHTQVRYRYWYDVPDDRLHFFHKKCFRAATTEERKEILSNYNFNS